MLSSSTIVIKRFHAYHFLALLQICIITAKSMVSLKVYILPNVL